MKRRFGATSQASAGSVAVRGVATALNLVVGIILARALGARGYGIYAFALATASMLSIPGRAALSTLALREIAGGMAMKRPDLVRGVMRWTMRRVLAFSLIAAVIAAAVGYGVGGSLEPGSRLAFGMALLLVPLMSLNGFRSATLRGLHYVVSGQVPEQIAVPGLMVVVIAGLLIAGRTDVLSAAGAVGLHVLAVVAAFGVATWMQAVRLPRDVRDAQPAYDHTRWSAAVWPLLFVSGFSYANREMGLLLVGALGGPAEAGIYRVAVRGAELVAFALSGINAAVAPRLAQLHAVNDIARLRRMLFLAASASLAWAVPFAAVMIVFGEWILTTVFGAEFAGGAAALAILAVGQVLNSATGPVGLLLNMTGRERTTAKGHAVALGVGVAGGLLLIPRWGVEGMAVAAALSVLTWNAVVSIEAARVLELIDGKDH